MATPSQTDAIRDYLVALKDPSALRDDDQLDHLRQQLEQTSDELERVRLHQQILDGEQPQIERYEDAFLQHAKAWADEQGVTAKAFTAEGVSNQVLRRAGFRVGRGGGRHRAASPTRRTRTSSDEIRKAIPSGTFTIKMVQEKTGASSAVVRRIVQEGVEEGSVKDQGPDPDHRGPGRSPTLYQKA
ncbi:MAG: hypothetical protein ACR2MA_04910 [Egibacteraceae bacterium]